MVVITTNFNGFAGGTPTGGRVSQFIVTHNYVVTHNLGDAIGQSLGVPGQNFKRSVLLSLRYAFVNTERHHLTVLAASPTTWTSPARRPRGRPPDRRLAGVRPFRNRSRWHHVAPRLGR